LITQSLELCPNEANFNSPTFYANFVVIVATIFELSALVVAVASCFARLRRLATTINARVWN